jgi:hypothetical protein
VTIDLEDKIKLKESKKKIGVEDKNEWR